MLPQETIRVMPGLALIRFQEELRQIFQASEVRVAVQSLDPAQFSLYRPYLNDSELRRSLCLNALFVPRDVRGKGLGSEAVRRIAAAADNWLVTLVLFAYPYDALKGSSEEFEQEMRRLEQFFSRFGNFTSITPGHMLRRPFYSPVADSNNV